MALAPLSLRSLSEAEMWSLSGARNDIFGELLKISISNYAMSFREPQRPVTPVAEALEATLFSKS
jgi:hypothetical protein